MTAYEQLFNVSTNTVRSYLGDGCCHMGITLKHPVPDRVKPAKFVIFASVHSDAQPWASECTDAKITNDAGLTRSATRCFIAVPIWQQWASKDAINAFCIVDTPLMYTVHTRCCILGDRGHDTRRPSVGCRCLHVTVCSTENRDARSHTSSEWRRNSDGSCGTGCYDSSPVRTAARRTAQSTSTRSVSAQHTYIEEETDRQTMTRQQGPTSHRLRVIGLMLNSLTMFSSWYMCSSKLSICNSTPHQFLPRDAPQSAVMLW